MGDLVGEAANLVVVVGSQASGKSAVASALAHDLRGTGETVVLVELDAIAAMALPTLPDWATAQAVFELAVRRWLQAPVSCVVAEGSGTADEVARLLEAAPAGTTPLVVALEAPFEVAHRRARADPSRGRSRDHDFLAAVYERWPQERDRLAPDLILQTHRAPVDACVRTIRVALDALKAGR